MACPLEVFAIGVETESGNTLFSGDGYWFLFLLFPHSLFQANW